MTGSTRRSSAHLLVLLFVGGALLSQSADAAEILVPARAGWRYLDNGSNQGTAWTTPGFNDSNWASGPAQLGYGDGDEHTVVSFGPNPSNKYITTYFRHGFSVADPGGHQALTLRLLRDDGAVVYLNGSEVFRSNMPPGGIGHLTPASTVVGETAENIFVSAPVDPDLLVAGANVLAAEIHQSSGTSSDVSFDLELVADPLEPGVVSVWSGALSPTSIRVNAKISMDTSQVRLLVSEHADLSGARRSPFFVANQATNNRVVSITMKGLKPRTSYHHAIELEGQVDTLHRGEFTTPIASPLSFTLALGSCADTGSGHPVFDTIRAHDPLFFLHLGDLHYENIAVNDAGLFRAAFDTVLGSASQSALHRATPIAYIWDDHDYGPNDSDRTSPSRQAARLTYQQYVPHYPLVAGAGDVPIYQAFSVGRVRFLLTDSRSERDPVADPDGPNKTMLGPVQKAWLEQELLEANGIYPVIVWVNTLPWIGTTGDDGWFVYTHERSELADFIALNGIEGLVMLSGDAHMLAIDDGTNSDYSASGDAGFPVFHAAALSRDGSVKGGPYSEGAFPGRGQFGLMAVDDDGAGPLCISWSGRNASDTELVGLDWCQSVSPPADTDDDGFLDVDDCSFADAGVWAAPTAVAGLRVSKGGGGFKLQWDSQESSAGPATVYDIVAGSISELRQDRDFRRSTCFADDLADTPHVDGSGLPPAGQARYFLVRAQNACGSGGYGPTTPQDPRFLLDGDVPCPLP